MVWEKSLWRQVSETKYFFLCGCWKKNKEKIQDLLKRKIYKSFAKKKISFESIRNFQSSKLSLQHPDFTTSILCLQSWNYVASARTLLRHRSRMQRDATQTPHVNGGGRVAVDVEVGCVGSVWLWLWWLPQLCNELLFTRSVKSTQEGKWKWLNVH